MSAAADLNINLEVLEGIMSELPAAQDGQERRKHNLTRDDVLIIAKIVHAMSVADNSHCNAGLTKKQVEFVQALSAGTEKSVSVVFNVILVVLTTSIVGSIGWALTHWIIHLTDKAVGGK